MHHLSQIDLCTDAKGVDCVCLLFGLRDSSIAREPHKEGIVQMVQACDWQMTMYSHVLEINSIGK